MEYQCKGTSCAAVVWLALAIVSTTTLAATEAFISGPQPMTVVAPVGAMVTFTCVVNTSELPGTFQSYSWIVDGVTLSGSIDQETTNGSLGISILNYKLLVIQDYITVQCQVVVQVSITVFMVVRSNNATITAYGI